MPIAAEQALTILTKTNPHVLQNQFAIDVLNGLSPQAHPKFIPSRYLYDETGSKLFHLITRQPEYYLTSSEIAILTQNAKQILQSIGGEILQIVELGAGADGEKVKQLIETALSQKRTFTFTPVDICLEAVTELCAWLNRECSAPVTVNGIVGDYFDALHYLSQRQQSITTLALFLGSNIGNFSEAETHQLLLRSWYALSDGDYLLIGFDLRKNVKLLNSAYNDKNDITAKFNLNLLQRINQELGGTFCLDDWQHYSMYDPEEHCMRSYLISDREQVVRVSVLNQEFHFNAQEPIQVEYSYKFAIEQIERMAKQAGFKVVDHFLDEKYYFCDSLWRVRKIN